MRNDGAGDSWWPERRAALVLALRRGRRHDLPRLAGSLAYNLVFAIFPALIVLVAALDVLGVVTPLINEALERIATLPADSPWQVLVEPLQRLVTGGAPAGPILIVGLGLMLWTGSNYIGAYQWAVGVIREVRSGRPYWRQLSWQLLLALVAYLVILAAVVVVVVTGPLAARIADALSAGDGVRTLWAWARFPLLFVVVSVLFAVFYQVAPGARRRHAGVFTTGSVVAVVAWLAVTLGFSAYVKYFARYDRIYGTLGAAVAFLVWLWLFNVALLACTEIDAALEVVRRKGLETSDSEEPPEDSGS